MLKFWISQKFRIPTIIIFVILSTVGKNSLDYLEKIWLYRLMFSQFYCDIFRVLNLIIIICYQAFSSSRFVKILCGIWQNSV